MTVTDVNSERRRNRVAKSGRDVKKVLRPAATKPSVKAVAYTLASAVQVTNREIGRDACGDSVV